MERTASEPAKDFVHPQRVRFDEIDFAQVVFFGQWFRYCHVALEEFYRAELGLSIGELFSQRGVGFPIVHVEADFKRPLRYDDAFEVKVKVEEIGARAVHYRFEVQRGDKVLGTVRIVTSCIGADFQGRDIPDEVRATLERHRVAIPRP